MSISLSSARILVISRSEAESALIKDFLSRIDDLKFEDRDFVSARLLPTDGYHFAIFNATSLPWLGRKEEEARLSPEDKDYLQFFRDCLKKPVPYILYYGEMLHDLDRDRCPAANSKFTLFARIRELIDFINHYRAA